MVAYGCGWLGLAEIRRGTVKQDVVRYGYVWIQKIKLEVRNARFEVPMCYSSTAWIFSL